METVAATALLFLDAVRFCSAVCRSLSIHDSCRSIQDHTDNQARATHAFKSISSVTSAAVSITAAFAVQNYASHYALRVQELCAGMQESSSWSPGEFPCEEAGIDARAIAAQHRLDQLPDGLPLALTDPGPRTLVWACMTCTLAVLIYHHFHRESDRYQNHFLILSYLMVLVVCTALHESLAVVMLGYVPWTAIFALLVSAGIHDWLRWIRKRRVRRERMPMGDEIGLEAKEALLDRLQSI